MLSTWHRLLNDHPGNRKSTTLYLIRWVGTVGDMGILVSIISAKSSPRTYKAHQAKERMELLCVNPIEKLVGDSPH